MKVLIIFLALYLSVRYFIPSVLRMIFADIFKTAKNKSDFDKSSTKKKEKTKKDAAKKEKTKKDAAKKEMLIQNLPHPLKHKKMKY
jgi:hypothetical protein